MDLRPGYKKTDIGIVPKDWEVTALGNIASISSGGTPLRKVGEYWNGDIPWVTTAQVDGNIIDGANEFISEMGLARSAARLLPPKTLLIAMYGQGKTRGKTAMLGIEATTNQACAAIQLTPNVNSDFVFRYLVERYEYIRSLSNSGNQENLSLKLVASIKTVLPPLGEQAEISAVLSDIDSALSALARLVSKKRDIRSGAIQLLATGKTRLHGFTKAWQTRRIGELLRIKHGKSQRLVEDPNGKYPILATGGQIGKSREPLCRKPSVLIGRKGTIDRPQFMATPFWSVDTLYYSEMLDGNVAKFLFYRFLLIEWRRYNEASGVPSLSARTIESIEIECPDPNEQQAIVEVLADMDADITALETRLEKTRALKQGMMQALLTGRVRLPVQAEALDALEVAHA